jgi:hypothetical protein
LAIVRKVVGYSSREDGGCEGFFKMRCFSIDDRCSRKVRAILRKRYCGLGRLRSLYGVIILKAVRCVRYTLAMPVRYTLARPLINNPSNYI